VDALNHFTVAVLSADRKSLFGGAQGVLRTDGSFEQNSSDQAIHFTGQIAPDHQTVAITAQGLRSGAITVSVPGIQKKAAFNPLPDALVGTFNGSATAVNGDRIQDVLLSIDPGGNATLEAPVISKNFTLFGYFHIAPDGRVLDSSGNGEAGRLQASGSALVLTITFQTTGSPAYTNTFVVPLQRF
jgi:hypothetical protein